MHSGRSGFSKTSSQSGLKHKAKHAVSPSESQLLPAVSPPSATESKAESEGTDPVLALKARDVVIEDLRKRVLQLATQAKRLDTESFAAKEKQLKLLLEDKASLLKQQKGLESSLSDLQSQLQALDSKHQEALQTQQLLSDALTEEGEKLKSQLMERSEQLNSAKTDIAQMSSIVQEMTSLNSELNEKILKMNQDMEQVNKTAFEASAKAQQCDELEKELVEEKTKTQRLEREVEENEQAKARLKSALAVIETVAEDLKSVENEEVRKAIEALQAIPYLLPAPNPAHSSDPNTLSTQIAHLKSQLKDEKREFARISKIDAVQRNRITALEAEKTKLRAELNYVIEKQKKQLVVLKDHVKISTEKAQDLADRLEKANSDLVAAQTSVIHLTARVNALKSQAVDSKKTEETLKQTIKSLKNALLDVQFDKTAFEASLQLRESNAKDATARLEAVTEEMWKKDNELVRKETQRLKLQEDFNALKTSLQSSHVQFKIKMSEEINKANSRIEGKEQEISELKRLVMQTGQSVPAKKAKGPLWKVEEAWKQMRILRDRARNGTGEEADRQVTETLRARGNATIAGLEKEVSLDTVVTAEEAAGFPLVKEAMKGAATTTVQELIEEMKVYLNQP